MPVFGIFSPDQSKCVIATKDQAILVDLSTGSELNLYDFIGIKDIKSCESDENNFYVMANTRGEKQELGMYFVQIPINDNK